MPGVTDRALTRPGADLADPLFPLLAVVALTALPYLWPMEHSGVLKYWTLDAHLGFCLVLLLANLGPWALYTMLVRTTPTVPEAHDGFADILLMFCRIAVFVAIAANLLLVVQALGRLGEGVWARKEIVADGEGIFILTQLHIWFLGPYVALSWLRGERFMRALGVLALLVFLRAVLVGERIALIEFLLPLLVVFSLLGVVRIGWFKLTLITVAVPVFFLATEIFRSFHAKFIDDTGTWDGVDLDFVIAWNLERFFSYYVDAANKFYVVISEGEFGQTQYWLNGINRVLYRFGLGDVPLEEEIFYLLDRFGVWAIELTNPGGLQQIASDFGSWGLLAYGLLVGALLTAHAAARGGSLFAYAAYPVLYVTFADMVRLVYVYETRAAVPGFLFLFAYVAARLIALSDQPRAGSTDPNQTAT